MQGRAGYPRTGSLSSGPGPGPAPAGPEPDWAGPAARPIPASRRNREAGRAVVGGLRPTGRPARTSGRSRPDESRVITFTVGRPARRAAHRRTCGASAHVRRILRIERRPERGRRPAGPTQKLAPAGLPPSRCFAGALARMRMRSPWQAPAAPSSRVQPRLHPRPPSRSALTSRQRACSAPCPP